MLYPWLVLVHVVASFIFILGHGVSVFVMFRARREPDRARLGTLLDLSLSSQVVTYGALLVALLAGLVAAISGDHFARGWPWATIVVVLLVGGVMTPLAAIPLNALRRALGQPIGKDTKQGIVPHPLPDADVVTLQARLRPELVSAIGLAGLVVLIWLMQAKPF